MYKQLAFWRIPPAFRSMLGFMPYDVRRMAYSRMFADWYAHQQSLRTDLSSPYSLRSFDEYECMFIHIPKTGGVSIAESLFGVRGGMHKTLRSYQLVFSKREFHEYFKFAFVRNPWDRLYSAFRFLRSGGMTQRDRKWAEQNITQFESFDEFVCTWVNAKSIYSEIHFVPQHEFLVDYRGRIGVDFVGRFECLDHDYRLVQQRLGIDRELLHLNKSRISYSEYRKYYSGNAREIVAQVYAKDIEFFGYEF